MRAGLTGLACLGLLGLIAFGAWTARPSGELRDYGSFVASGRAAGEGADPYGVHPLTFRVSLPGFEIENPNLNPPISVPLFGVLGSFDPERGFRAWWVASLICYVLAVAALLRRYGLRKHWLTGVWALALAGLWDTLALGQIYLPLVLAATGAWLLLERGRLVAAGVLIGIVAAFKPNFATWIAVLLLAGHARTALAAGATMLGLWLVPLAMYGPTIYMQWLALITQDEGRGAFLTNVSLPGLAARVGLAPAGLVASLAVLAALGAWAARGRRDAMEASALGILGGILASPLAWIHYTLFLLPAFFKWRLPAPMFVAAVLLVVPVRAVLELLDAPLWQQATLGSLYTWAMLCAAAGVVLIVAKRSEARNSVSHAHAVGFATRAR